jgi:CRP-like cAMP-binding protein
MLDFDAKTLDAITIFKSLTQSERDAIAQQCQWRRFHSQETIIDAHQRDSDVYFIVRGMIRVVSYGSNGKEVSFADIEAGDCFGELSAIDGKDRSAMVVALEPTFTATLSAKQFNAIIDSHPTVCKALLYKLTALVRSTSARIMDLSTLGANNRVYAEILRQANNYLNTLPTMNRDSARIILSPAPTHSDIAARVSTTRETVARSMSILAKRKILKRIKGGIEVTDKVALQNIVEEFRDN